MFKKRQTKFIIFSLLCGLILAYQSVAAQETSRVQAATATATEAATEAVQEQVRKPTRASKAAGKDVRLRAAIEECGADCDMGGGSGMISAGEGGTLEYDCDENGNCACFGASDCVKMAPICKEGSLGCNDQGCICEEG